jgi:hypothetical protein
VVQVEGGQAMRGSIAGPADLSTASASIVPQNASVFPGVSRKSIKGSIGPDVNAVALGVAGDSGYWLVPALTPELTDPHSFTFTAALSVSRSLRTSPLLVDNGDGTSTLPLSARAVDSSGNFGPAFIQGFILDAPTLAGSLIVSLDWDAPVDLDLHVQVPAANPTGFVDVWAKARSASPKSTPPDGVLDFDCNANCQLDGRGGENVVWQGQPPTGHYVVRVDAFSLCGQTAAAWHAIAYTPDGILGEASGVLTEAGTRQNPAAGAGITAFEFYR